MLRFFDGFDHYTNADFLKKWTSWSNTMNLVAARNGNGLSIASRWAEKVIDAQSEWIVGFAFSFGATSGPIMAFFNGATKQVDLYWDNTTGKLSVRRAGTTTLGTTTATFSQGVFYFVELRIVISDTVGVVQLKVDGATVLNLSSQDTLNSGSTADRVRFGDGGSSNVPGTVDDLYICDGSGSSPYNTFLGDCKVETRMPNGNGNSSQLVGNDGNSTDNYLLVDETTPNSDTDYVESSTVGDKDTYTYQDLATATGTVYAVQILPYAKKTDAGSRSIVTVARLSGTEVDSAAATLASTYSYPSQEIRTTKPGGGAWTISDVNSAEFGVKVNA
jgi:hypothetical protein